MLADQVRLDQGAPRAPGPTCSTWCRRCSWTRRPACVPPSSSASISAPTPSAPLSFRARTAARWERPSSTIRAGTTACCCTRGTRTWRARTPLTTARGCASVIGALAGASRHREFARHRVIGIGVDTTGSTPLPIDAAARPLAMDARWRENLAAHAWLWKDHTGAAEAAAITDAARTRASHLLAPIGGTYSSEWWWSKIWHCLKVAPDVFDAAASWVELRRLRARCSRRSHGARQIVRCICAAGHKRCTAMRGAASRRPSSSRRSIPGSRRSVHAVRSRAAAWHPAGHLCREWAATFDLPEGIPIAMGAFDAHYAAVGAGVRPGTLVKIIGTSTRDCAVLPMTATNATTFHGFRGSAASCPDRSCRAFSGSKRVSRPSAIS